MRLTAGISGWCWLRAREIYADVGDGKVTVERGRTGDGEVGVGEAGER